MNKFKFCIYIRYIGMLRTFSEPYCIEQSHHPFRDTRKLVIVRTQSIRVGNPNAFVIDAETITCLLKITIHGNPTTSLSHDIFPLMLSRYSSLKFNGPRTFLRSFSHDTSVHYLSQAIFKPCFEFYIRRRYVYMMIYIMQVYN